MDPGSMTIIRVRLGFYVSRRTRNTRKRAIIYIPGKGCAEREKRNHAETTMERCHQGLAPALPPLPRLAAAGDAAAAPARPLA